MPAALLLIQQGAAENMVAPQLDPMRAKMMVGPSYRGSRARPMTEFDP
jgi:hypothetical protein